MYVCITSIRIAAMRVVQISEYSIVHVPQMVLFESQESYELPNNITMRFYTCPYTLMNTRIHYICSEL